MQPDLSVALLESALSALQEVPMGEPVAGAPWSPVQAAALLGIGAFVLWLGAMARPAMAEAAASMEVDTDLSWGEKVGILLLTIVATALGLVAWFTILGLIAGALSILALAWSLFGFMIWPWEDEFLEFYDRNRFLAFLFGALILVPVAVGVAVLAGVVGWPLVVIGAVFAIWWGIFVLRCGWIYWVERHVRRFLRWALRQIQWIVTQYYRVVQYLRKQVRRTYRQQRRVRKRRCANWHWALRWVCVAWTWVVVLVWVLVTVLVWVVVTVVTIVVVTVLVVVWVLVLIVVVVVMFVIKLVFWCW